MRHVLLAASLAAIGSTGCAHFECTAHGGREVRALKTEHFVVTSDLPAGEHRAEAERLELLWDTFAAFFGADVAEAAIPVVVLADQGDVDAFAPGYSGFVTRSDPEVLVVGARAKPEGVNVNAHELAHLVSAYLLPRQPRWVAEGLASIFEDATFKDARTVKMGLWNASRAEEAFVVGVASLDRLEAWDELTFDDSENNLYASAWAYVHYFANHDEARLKRLFTALQGPRPLSEVLAQVFPKDERAALQARVKAYVGDARFRGWQTRLMRTPKVSSARVLAPWEVHLLRSRMHLKDEKAPAREVETAQALAPAPAPAAVEVAHAREAQADVTPLLASHPAAPEVLVAAHRAGLKIDPAALEKALTAHPADASLLATAAEVAAQANDVEKAEALATRGLALAPWSARLSMTLVLTSLAKHACDDAERRLAVTMALAPERPSDGTKKSWARAREMVKTCRARAAR